MWCAQHGLLVSAPAEATFTHAPLSLLPTPFPRAAYERALELARPFGTLMCSVAQDAEFLHTTLSGACALDDFTARLVQLHKATHKVRAVLLQPLASLRILTRLLLCNSLVGLASS